MSLGARYREVLHRLGNRSPRDSDRGGVENLARLRDPRSGVKVAFLESGLTTQEESPDLISLGTISLAPLWWFFRRQALGRGKARTRRREPWPEAQGQTHLDRAIR